MIKPGIDSRTRTLTKHFFARFFHIADDGAAETPVVRALAGVAAPMLMAAFWIVTMAHDLTSWGAAEVHYLFVLYAFCAMGCITALQWEALFPERIDFLILLPMPLKGRTLFVAKLQAVAAFLLLFLFAANIFATLLIPALAGRRILLAMFAHALAVFAAGAASTLAVLTLEALAVALTPDRWLRQVTFVLQVTLVAGFVLLFLRMGTVSEQLPHLLSGSMPDARYIPTLWFEALYERVFGEVPATAFITELSRWALLCVPILLMSIGVTYPAAWAKRRRVALEGVRSSRFRDGVLWSIAYRTFLRRADQRAVFHFIRQTLLRLNQYHVLLAAYCGAGIALSSAVALTVGSVNGHIDISLWPTGAQAVMPILLFWTVAGLRVAFVLPADLAARWIFQLAPLHTRQVISTAKLLVFGVSSIVIAAVLTTLAFLGWSAADLRIQLVFALPLVILLIDIFFFLESSIPFTRPLLPGRSSLPLTLSVFVFGLPTWVIMVLTLDRWAGHTLWRVGIASATMVTVHGVIHWVRSLPSHPVSNDAFLGEGDQDVQTLGLSA